MIPSTKQWRSTSGIPVSEHNLYNMYDIECIIKYSSYSERFPSQHPNRQRGIFSILRNIVSVKQFKTRNRDIELSNWVFPFRLSLWPSAYNTADSWRTKGYRTEKYLQKIYNRSRYKLEEKNRARKNSGFWSWCWLSSVFAGVIGYSHNSTTGSGKICERSKKKKGRVMIECVHNSSSTRLTLMLSSSMDQM